MPMKGLSRKVYGGGEGRKEDKKMGLNVACVAGGLRFWALQTAGGWVSRRLLGKNTCPRTDKSCSRTNKTNKQTIRFPP